MNSIPPFSLPGVGQVDNVNAKFLRPFPGKFPVDGLVVGGVIFLVCCQIEFCFCG